jgi:hypothetical protein
MMYSKCNFKIVSKKTRGKKLFSVGVLKATDEKKEQDLNPDTDPLVHGSGTLIFFKSGRHQNIRNVKCEKQNKIK